MAETLSTYALTDLATVKQALELTTSGDDDLLTRLINAVTFFVENVATNGRRFKAREDQVEYYDGRGSQILFVRHHPIVAVNSLYDDSLHAWGSDTVIASTDYRIYSDEGFIRLANGRVFVDGIQNVKLDYDYGWATIPEEIRDVATELVVLKYNALKDKTLDRTGQRFADGSVSFTSKDLLPEHREVLDHYKKTVIGAI